MPKVRSRLDPYNPPTLSDESAARWDATTDAEIDYSDAPPLDPAFWREVEPHSAAPKPTVIQFLSNTVLNGGPPGGIPPGAPADWLCASL